MLINTSPEPVSNWLASFAEDIVVVGGLWTAFNYPLLFLVLLATFLLAVLWLLPKIWGLIKLVVLKIGRFLNIVEEEPSIIAKGATGFSGKALGEGLASQSKSSGLNPPRKN